MTCRTAVRSRCDVRKVCAKTYNISNRFSSIHVRQRQKTAVSYLHSSDKIIILGNSSSFSVPWYDLTILGTK